MYLAGKSLNALLLDPVERDLVHVEQFNQLLALGVDSAGAPFLEAAEKTAGIHPVNTLFLRPRDDLGSLARQIFEANPPKVPAMLRRLLSMAADREHHRKRICSVICTLIERTPRSWKRVALTTHARIRRRLLRSLRRRGRTRKV